ncbi:menaquinone-dependent protoporphyrinogen IX dehydrogenase [Vibrio rhizosphaerae]|uniref:Protoporphyrinogen IX dehydrogenase [quinone] n=1 Tax=Vibrio rhizosphaerae TaxID=398736 RepID=A0ABU4IPP5_9VIBR|nr:menaquinone-dependent protoporphyrinogen IX dehydrogenase [Vibrio rhizosphaerae]MDW6091380.1 menaquinone-dependent protoporphyrinogen IX dehydrogenase [Vibrio rhizosphaerae]
MKKILCLYSTREGQTKKIVEHIVAQLDGYESEFVDLHLHPKLNLALYDKVLIGASIRYGRLHQSLYQFIDHHARQLDEANAAFICVNLTARKEEQKKDTPEGSVYIQTFLRQSAWQPKLIGVFAGALRYPRYRFFDRMMIRLIMKMTGGETDTSKEVEYTNWHKVDLFAQKFKDM